jgi:hypothetical protein
LLSEPPSDSRPAAAPADPVCSAIPLAAVGGEAAETRTPPPGENPEELQHQGRNRRKKKKRKKGKREGEKRREEREGKKKRKKKKKTRKQQQRQRRASSGEVGRALGLFPPQPWRAEGRLQPVKQGRNPPLGQ